MADHDIAAKVKKLLAKAADQQGKPEGEVYYQKAFDLMARYGISEAELAEGEPDENTHVRFTLEGSYTDMKKELVGAIAVGLRCAIVYQPVYKSTRVEWVDVYGLRRNVERIELLYAMLVGVMAALAEESAQRREPWVSAASQKRSFMLGFANGIRRRLA